ncbi:hypothetical protein M422DRAFT_776808 [Sphaerobolus stellatus SS14]|nr:hypothetical protein M422DRAFT_776808 [Sphaerobolus stellatus SS14]
MISMDKFSDDGGRGTYYVEFVERADAFNSSLSATARKTGQTVMPLELSPSHPPPLERIKVAPWVRKKSKSQMTRTVWPLLLQAISNTFDSRLPQRDAFIPTVNIYECLDDDDNCFYCGDGSHMDVNPDPPLNTPSAASPLGNINNTMNSNSNSWNGPISVYSESPSTNNVTYHSPSDLAQNAQPFSPLESNKSWSSNIDIPLGWPPSPLLSTDPCWQHTASEMGHPQYPFAYSASLTHDSHAVGHVSGLPKKDTIDLTCNYSNEDGNEEYRPRSSRGDWEVSRFAAKLRSNSVLIDQQTQRKNREFSKVIQRPARHFQHPEVPESPRLPALGDDFDDEDDDDEELQEIDFKFSDNRMDVDAPVYLYQACDRASTTATRTYASVPSPPLLGHTRNVTQPSGRPSRIVTPPPLSETLTPQSRWKLQIVQQQRSLKTRGMRPSGFPISPLNPERENNRNRKSSIKEFNWF